MPSWTPRKRIAFRRFPQLAVALRWILGVIPTLAAISTARPADAKPKRQGITRVSLTPVCALILEPGIEFGTVKDRVSPALSHKEH